MCSNTHLNAQDLTAVDFVHFSKIMCALKEEIFSDTEDIQRAVTNRGTQLGHPAFFQQLS